MTEMKLLHIMGPAQRTSTLGGGKGWDRMDVRIGQSEPIHEYTPSKPSKGQPGQDLLGAVQKLRLHEGGRGVNWMQTIANQGEGGVWDLQTFAKTQSNAAFP